MKYAINSNRIKKRPIGEIVELSVKVGAEGIEWGLPDLESSKTLIHEMASSTSNAGLEIAGYLNGGKLWKIDEMREWSEVVSSVGGKSLRVAHPWIAYNYEESLHQGESHRDIENMARAGLKQLVELSKEYRIKYVMEIHAGSLCSSPHAAVRLVEGLDPNCIGIIYDVANTVVEGFTRPRTAVELLGAHLAYVHAKNVSFHDTGDRQEGSIPRALWKHRYRELDQGIVDYLEVMFALKMHGFEGWVCLEEFFEDDEHLPEVIQRNLDFIRRCEQEAPCAPELPYTTFNA